MSNIELPFGPVAEPTGVTTLRLPTPGATQGTQISGSHDAQISRFQHANDTMRLAQPQQFIRELEVTLAYVEANAPARAPEIRALLEDAKKKFAAEFTPQLNEAANNGEIICTAIQNRTASLEEGREALRMFRRDHGDLTERLQLYRETIRRAVDDLLGGTPAVLENLRKSIDAVLSTIHDGVDSAATALQEAISKLPEREPLDTLPTQGSKLPKLPEELVVADRRDRLDERRDGTRQPSIHDTKTILDTQPRFEAEFLVRRGVFDTPILTPPMYREDDEVLRARAEIARRLEARGKHIPRDLQGHIAEADELQDFTALMLQDDERDDSERKTGKRGTS